MTFTVSIRDLNELERQLKQGKQINLPLECRHNSNVIFNLLQYAPEVLPKFKSLTEEEVKTISQSVAYIMRPDLLFSPQVLIGPQFFSPPKLSRIYGEDGLVIHLKNDPNQLGPDFELPKDSEYHSIGAEMFRCYAGTLHFMPKVLEKLDPLNNSFTPSFPLADLTAFLLSPQDLTRYDYTPQEVSAFHNTLLKEMKEI